MLAKVKNYATKTNTQVRYNIALYKSRLRTSHRQTMMTQQMLQQLRQLNTSHESFPLEGGSQQFQPPHHMHSWQRPSCLYKNIYEQ
jgi:hypothetical protein